MKQLLGIALLLGIGLVVSHRWFGKTKIAGKARFYYLTGEEFLLLGLLLGPYATNLIDRTTLASLEPFVGLGLGYIGFVFGMQFRLPDLARVPGRFYAATAAHNLHNLGALFVPVVVGLAVLADAAWTRTLPIALALVATALGTSTSFLALVDRKTRLGRSELFRFMRFSSVFDDLFGVALFGVALCLLRAPGAGAAWGAAGAVWLGVCLLLAVLFASFLLAAVQMKLEGEHLLLVLIGLLLTSGGLAMHLRLSPLFCNLVAGVLVCNLHHGSQLYQQTLLQVERPIYLFMLVLAGAMWKVQIGGLLAVVALYVLCRALGKTFGGRLAARVLGGRVPRELHFGFGQMAQSEMAVAMMVNLLVLHDEPLSRLAVSAVFVSVVVNDLLSSAYFSYNYRGA